MCGRLLPTRPSWDLRPPRAWRVLGLHFRFIVIIVLFLLLQLCVQGVPLTRPVRGNRNERLNKQPCLPCSMSFPLYARISKCCGLRVTHRPRGLCDGAGTAEREIEMEQVRGCRLWPAAIKHSSSGLLLCDPRPARTRVLSSIKLMTGHSVIYILLEPRNL